VTGELIQLSGTNQPNFAGEFNEETAMEERFIEDEFIADDCLGLIGQLSLLFGGQFH
jgi:hypothetical protein